MKKSVINNKKQSKFQQNGSSPVDDSKSPLIINIADLPEDEKLKIGRLVEKLFEISQKHENTLDLLNKERIQHQQELQSLNQHIEEQVTIIETQIKLKDDKIAVLQNKEQMLTAMVALYQKKLRHVLELHSLTQQTDQSFQNKLLEKEKECETYQQIIQSRDNVLSTYEENAKSIQRSLQQQVLLEQKKVQEQHVQIQELSQQVYLLQQDYQNLRYYYKLHSPNHEIPKQLHNNMLASSQESISSLPATTPASATSLQPPHYSLNSPVHHTLPPTVLPTSSRHKDSGNEDGDPLLRTSTDTTSTLGMVSISADPSPNYPQHHSQSQQQQYTSQSQSQAIARSGSSRDSRDKDQYSNYSLLYHTSFSSPDSSALLSVVPIPSFGLTPSQRAQVDISTSSLMNSIDSIGSYKKPPTPRQYNANTNTNNQSINLSDADIVVGSDDFHHAQHDLHQHPQQQQQQQQPLIQPPPAALIPQPAITTASATAAAGQSRVTRGIAITSPPTTQPAVSSSSVASTTQSQSTTMTMQSSTSHTSKTQHKHSYSLLHLLSPSQPSQQSQQQLPSQSAQPLTALPHTPSTPATTSVALFTPDSASFNNSSNSNGSDRVAGEQQGAVMAMESGMKKRKKVAVEGIESSHHNSNIQQTSSHAQRSDHLLSNGHPSQSQTKVKVRVKKDAMVEMLDEMAGAGQQREQVAQQHQSQHHHQQHHHRSSSGSGSGSGGMNNVTITSKKKIVLDSIITTNNNNSNTTTNATTTTTTPRPKKVTMTIPEYTPPDNNAKRKIAPSPRHTPSIPTTPINTSAPSTSRTIATNIPTHSPPDKVKVTDKMQLMKETNKPSSNNSKGQSIAYEPQLFDLLAEMEIRERR